MEMATRRCEASTNVSTIWLVKFFALFVNLTNIDEEQCKRYGFQSNGGRLELIVEASYYRHHGYKEIPLHISLMGVI